MKINFCNNGVLSLIDLVSMGDSSKKNDMNTIGMYDSGLKFSMCICYRNNIKMTIKSGQYKYDLDSIEVGDIKKKTMLVIDQYDLEDNHIEQVVTGFSIEMGHTWLKWYAVRELYSNMKDEKGYMCIDSSEEILANEFDTVITLESDQLDEIYEHWNDYFLEQDCINSNSEDDILIYKNIAKDGLFRIYKQNILIYTDETYKSNFVYNCKSATIDERRVLSNYHDVRYDISRFIEKTNDVNIIEAFVNLKDNDDKTFEETIAFDKDYFSQSWIYIVNNTKPQYLMKDLRKALISNKHIELESKIIRAGFSWHSPSVEIKELVVEEINAVTSLTNECDLINLEIRYPLQQSKIQYVKCAPDPDKKIIYVDSTFDKDKDMWQFIKAQYILDRCSEDQIYKDYYELLKQVS
jgi:hypothetical protein